MQSSKESQCYFVQLQVDSFLDGELASAQRENFLGHVHQCEACAKELYFAQRLHDAVMDLPLLDCAESVLEPTHRISENKALSKPSAWQGVSDWLLAMPLSVRLAAPAFALLFIALSVTLPTSGPLTPNQQLAGQAPAEQFSPEDVQQALQDLNLAIDYLNDVSQRTEVMIGERFLVNPLQESLNASFERARDRNSNAVRRSRVQNNPI